MKVFCLTLLFCIFFSISQGQTVRPYQAVLATKSGKLKGVLHSVDSSKVVLNVDGQFITANTADIQWVKIRRTKPPYKAKNYMGNRPQVEYKLDRNGYFVDKWGHRPPSLGDEVIGAGYNTFFNGVINVIAFPIHAINPNLAKINLAQGRNAEQLNQLSYYSISYQSNPNNLAMDLKKLKAVAENAKQ